MNNQNTMKKKNKQGKTILLSFDLEEFDTPKEFGGTITFADELDVSRQGLAQVLMLLKKYNITATMYCTGVFAEHNVALIREIAEAGHEVASHTYDHGVYTSGDAQKSKAILERIVGKPIYGIRMPRMQNIDNNELRGYVYNSSLNPTYLPGRYNHLDKPRVPFLEGGLLQFPASVTPGLRIPLFWISFHNFPVWLYRTLCRWTMAQDGYLNIYFHPWEFYDLRLFPQLPFYFRRMVGEDMVGRFDKWLAWCLANEYQFSNTHEFLQESSN